MATIIKQIQNSNYVPSNTNQTGYTAVNSSQFWWDSAKYDGTVTMYWECILKSTNASYTAYSELYDKTGAAAVTDSPVSTTSTTPVRARSAAITLTTEHEYYSLVKISNAAAYVYYYNSQLVIKQTGTITKTETQVFLGSGYATTSSTYEDFAHGTLFYYNSGVWDGSVTVYFEAELVLLADATDAYAALYDTDDNLVADSEVHITASGWTRQRSAAITLTHGKTYKVKYKCDGGGSGINVRQARLIIQQANFNTTESHYPIVQDMKYTDASNTTLNTLMAVYWDNDEWDVYSKLVYHEAVLQILGGGGTITATAELYDGAAVDDSLATTSGNKDRVRSAALTLDDNTTYWARIKTSNGSYQASLFYSAIVVYAILTSTPHTKTLDTETATLTEAITSAAVRHAPLTSETATLTETITQTLHSWLVRVWHIIFG